MTGEEWRPVVGYEGLYEISDRGQVRSLPREVPSSNRWGGSRTRKYRGKKLSVYTNGKYHQVRLCRGGGSPQRHAFIHRLVAEAFIPNPAALPQVLHWDDDPSNNSVGNLRWGTQRENERDKIRNRTL